VRAGIEHEVASRGAVAFHRLDVCLTRHGRGNREQADPGILDLLARLAAISDDTFETILETAGAIRSTDNLLRSARDVLSTRPARAEEARGAETESAPAF
jgi:hypothetical protein